MIQSNLNQNVRRDHATLQQDFLLHFWVILTFSSVHLSADLSESENTQYFRLGT